MTYLLLTLVALMALAVHQHHRHSKAGLLRAQASDSEQARRDAGIQAGFAAGWHRGGRR